MAIVAAIILAAGRSVRMGRNKLLMSIGDKPLLRRVAEAVLASRARPVLLVTGHDEESVKEVVADFPVTIVHNPDFQTGLSSSIRAGVAALPDDTDGVLIVLADMPAVSGPFINRMIEAFTDRKGPAIWAAARNETRGNPVLFDKRYYPELLTLTGDVGARRLLTDEESVVHVEADDDSPIVDIDTPEALANYLSHWHE